MVQAKDNRPLIDNGWRVGMPIGDNPRTESVIQVHTQLARGIIDDPGVFGYSRHGRVQRIAFVEVRGYGILGR